jgi:hypothetical protein
VSAVAVVEYLPADSALSVVAMEAFDELQWKLNEIAVRLDELLPPNEIVEGVDPLERIDALAKRMDRLEKLVRHPPRFPIEVHNNHRFDQNDREWDFDRIQLAIQPLEQRPRDANNWLLQLSDEVAKLRDRVVVIERDTVKAP